MSYQINVRNPVQYGAIQSMNGRSRFTSGRPGSIAFPQTRLNTISSGQTLPRTTQIPHVATITQSPQVKVAQTQFVTTKAPSVSRVGPTNSVLSFPSAQVKTVPRNLQFVTTTPGLSNSRIMQATTLSPQKTIIYTGGRSPQKVIKNFGPYNSVSANNSIGQSYSSQVQGLQLLICIYNVRGLKDNVDLGSKPDPFVRYFIGDESNASDKHKTATVNNVTDADFNHTDTIDLSQIAQGEIASQNLNVVVYDKDLVSSSQIAGVHVPLREAIYQQGRWVAKWYQLRDKEGKDGHGAVQVAFKLVTGPQGPFTPPPSLPYEVEQQVQAVTYPGFLNVNVKCARNLKNQIMDKVDPYIELKINKGDNNKRKSETISDNNNPAWDFKTKFDCDVKQDDWNNLFLDFAIYDDDIGIDDLLGKNQIDISMLFGQPYQWINQEFSLKDKKDKPMQGSVYIQVQWQPNNQEGYPYQLPTYTPEPQNILGQEFERLKNLHEEKKNVAIEKIAKEFPNSQIIEGELNFFCVAGKDLESKDTFGSSDPYVSCKLNVKECKSSWHSKIKNKNLNPEWMEAGKIDVALPQEKFQNIELLVSVWDSDVEGDDLIGKVNIELNEALTTMQGRWINQIYPLKDKEGNNAGKSGILSFMYQWKPSGQQQDEVAPNPLDINAYYRGVKPVGTVIVGCVQGNYLLGVKEGQLSDPWVKLSFDKHEQKSKHLENTVNPQWNELFHFNANYLNRARVPDLKVEVYSGESGMFNSAQFIGQFSTSVTQILDFPNQWGTYQMYDLEDPDKKCKHGAVQGKLTLKLGFATDKENISKIQLA